MAELISEAAVGKSHTSLLFSNPILVDLTVGGKSKFNVQKLYPKDWESRYFRIVVYEDIIKALIKAHNEDRKTFIIETGTELRLLLGERALKDLQKDKPQREALGTYEWKEANNLFKVIVSKCLEEYKMNLVITAELKDEWKSKEKTGRRERDGYPKMDFYCDLRLYMKIEEEITSVNPEVKTKKRVALVVKNGLVDSLSTEWVGKIELLYDNDPSKGETFRKIMELTKLQEERWVK